MSLSDIDDVIRLQKINAALVDRVEQAMDQQRNAFSLFQTAISLEGQVRRRTDELTSTLRTLEETNIELARQKDISEGANRSKTQFLAAASHDILQPLNAAQLTISSLYDLQVSEQARQMVNQVERSLDTMNELLRTLLDISKLDAGVTTPRFASVPIPPILASLLSDLRPIAEKKGLRLRVAVTNDCVYTDRLMLRRALQNLITNAIRYTDRGGVLIGTRRRGDDISIEVIDTGAGIHEDQLEMIFEEFHRGPPSSRRRGARNRAGPGSCDCQTIGDRAQSQGLRALGSGKRECLPYPCQADRRPTLARQHGSGFRAVSGSQCKSRREKDTCDRKRPGRTGSHGRIACQMGMSLQDSAVNAPGA